MRAARAARYAAQFRGNMSAGLDAIAKAAVTGQWRQVLAGANSIHQGTHHLHEAAVADALGAGADWWTLGQVLGRDDVEMAMLRAALTVPASV